MTHRADVAGGRDIVARWCNLAEQRLEYLTELFETGRWRRYHSERAFLENIQEAKAAVEAWRDLVTREASLDNSVIDFSWLNGARTPLPRREGFRQPLQRPHTQPAPVAPMAVEPEREIPGEIPGDVLVALESQLVASYNTPSVPDAPDLDEMPLAALDLDVMQERYPLLRNAL